jgi:hypothetical protein
MHTLNLLRMSWPTACVQAGGFIPLRGWVAGASGFFKARVKTASKFDTSDDLASSHAETCGMAMGTQGMPKSPSLSGMV